MNEQIQAMINWIEQRLKESFSLHALSEYMGYSPYYCSFKFHQLTGISIKRYVLLKRLYLSTEELVGRRIIDVAVDYGYSSQEAYSRAFKAVFRINPRDYQMRPLPVQSFEKIIIDEGMEWLRLNISRKMEVKQLQAERAELFDSEVLNILNGQMMYEEFRDGKLMGDSDYVPFNEAMCVNATTKNIFDQKFVRTRALGHRDSVDNYTKKVINPLEKLFTKEYRFVVLWFGEDMFCQMNLLTILAYLEQSRYEGKVFLNCFREDEFNVHQIELTLGCYRTVYEDVLIRHTKPAHRVLPVMYQAIEIYLDMLKEDHEVLKYIAKHKELSTSDLLSRLFKLFPNIGYGDSQYIALINQVKSNDHL